MSLSFYPSDALGYHTYSQLKEKFLHLNQKNPMEKNTSEEEVSKRVSTTYWGKNISNFVGYFFLAGTVQAILKIALFVFLDKKLNAELKEIGQSDPQRKKVIEEIKDFHKWEKIRTCVEFFSLGIVLIPLDLVFTVRRNSQ